MSSKQPPPSTHRLHNRLSAILAHTTRYSFQGPARLARDLGVARSTILRLLSGEAHPSVGLALALLPLLEQAVGRRLDMRELFSFDGLYPTPSVCDLVGCRGCLPAEVYERDDTLKAEYRALRPGRWPACARSPAHSSERESEQDGVTRREDSS